MNSPALFSLQSRPLTVLHGDLERHALAQGEVFVGTAGSVVERENASGFRFYARQFYDGDGKKRETYLAGPVGAPAADGLAGETRARIGELKAIVPSLRLLGREGFCLADAKTYATLASLANHGVFSAGAMLIGSHAFGVLLNRLGIRAATSFKQRGRAPFHLDLLVPSPNETFPVVAVPELKAHAIGLPYLDFLLADSQTAALLAREGCCAVRVPLPERFAVHKLLVSRLRTGRDAKSTKDVLQACVLCASLAESHPGAVADALAAVPRRARKALAAGIESARRYLETAHPRAWEELGAGRAAR